MHLDIAPRPPICPRRMLHRRIKCEHMCACERVCSAARPSLLPVCTHVPDIVSNSRHLAAVRHW